jgi:Fur family ferric uptake transcriptional regulator
MSKLSNISTIEAILGAHRLKKTKARLRLVSLIATSSGAIAQTVIARKMKPTSRSTLYRTLALLEKSGIIDKVFNFRGTPYYSFAHPDRSVRMRVYFNCLVCKKMYCLDALEAFAVFVREGFNGVVFTLCFFGKCPKCDKSR